MRVFKMLSRVANFFLIFCFFLPFAPLGCGAPSARELAEKAKGDSVHRADSLKLLKLPVLPEPMAEMASTDSVPKGAAAPDSIKKKDTTAKRNAVLVSHETKANETQESFWNYRMDYLVFPPNAISGFGFIWVGIASMIEGNLSTPWYGMILLAGFFMSYLSVIFLAFYGLGKRAYTQKLLFRLSLVSWIVFLVFFFVTLSFHEMLYGFWTTAFVWMVNLGLIFYIRRGGKQKSMDSGFR
jgi:hypothetical protein